MRLDVEEVAGRVAFRHFVELPYLMYRGEPRWAPPQIAYERWRLDPDRNPFFERGDGAYFLLRRNGKVAGRITAHVAREGDEAGWFGFYDVVDDETCAAKLAQVASSWLAERGCHTMTGPVSFTVDQEAGVLVEGFDTAGTTGRQWHPPWYAAGLEKAGLVPVEGSEVLTWRLPSTLVRPAAEVTASGDVEAPPVAGSHVDRRLLLRGAAGTIAAAPDLAGAAGGSAWKLAKRLRRGQVSTCTVVRVDGDESALVPALLRAANDAGYRDVISPWTPDPIAPETVHRLYTTFLG